MLPRNFAGRSCRAVFCTIVALASFGSRAFLPDALSQDTAPPKDAPRIKYRTAQVAAGSGGVYAYVPEKWSTLHLHLMNPHDEPVEVLCSSYFVDEPTLQYGRRVWLPAKSRLHTWHPIKVPALPETAENRFDFRTLVVEVGKASEVLVRDDSGKMQLDGLLKANRSGNITGMVDAQIPPPGKTELDDSTMELVWAVRTASLLPQQVSHITDRILPAGEENLDPLDQLVVADNRVLHDDAAMTAIRRWLYNGGHLWVMLDRVDPRILEELLGDEYTGEIVDRVGLTTVRLEPGPQATALGKFEAEFEEPVDLVRMLISGVDVPTVVNGWPAAFWKNCGEGKLLVTTLAPRGWMRLRGPKDPKPNSPDVNASRFIALEPMENIGAEFLAARQKRLLQSDELEPLVREYVGYSIPPRWLVLGLLAGFCLLLAGLGAWFWSRGNLERLGLFGPILALAVSALLIGVGWQQRRSIPPTVASVQFVETIPGTDDVIAHGAAGVFAVDSGEAQLGAESGGLLTPELSGTAGTTRRMVWTDLDAWHWENLPQSTGLRNSKFQGSREFAERVEARATFTSEGLVGQIAGISGHAVGDALVATRDGRVGVDLKTDGSFTARADQVFSQEQYLGADLLSDEQNRRRRALELLLNESSRPDYPSRPMLLFWSDPWDLGFRFAEGARSYGAALFAAPLQLERPEVGTEVAIPSPLLAYRAVVGPDGVPSSGLYDYKKRAWQEKLRESSTWLRFQVPQELLPFETTSGRLEIQVSGPVGELELSAAKPGRHEPIHVWPDPVGTLTFDFKDPNVLLLDADGGVILRIRGGKPEEAAPGTLAADPSARPSYWKIESLSLDLRGKVLGAPPADVAPGPGKHPGT